MPEYIEKEAIKAAVRKRLNNSLIISWLIRIINEIPAADVVPVVRCKDCKHYWKNKNTPGYLDKCVTVSDDDYCSSGERKDGEG